MMIRKQDLKGLAARLKARTLTTGDAAVLAEVLKRYTEGTKGKSVAGRPIVARLPFGMDVIK